ncbi:tyrosine-type recombinase/integrase [Dactylosporangium sp. CA-152071]|uniref:tyrosine-type recombinase/integrase n=1 Tax=Dactylosporangium sp. CA-152071 TaxID=3239933 RepID=UPI003D8A98F8
MTAPAGPVLSVTAKQPKTPKKLIPVMRDDDTKKLLDACKGKSFVNLRDEALIRLYCNTGARLSEVGNLLLTDLDLNTESVRFHGKGAKDRRVRFGPKTARALSKYLRARAKRRDVEQVPNLWLAERGARLLLPNGIKIRLKRIGLAAGLTGVHAHRWRHNFGARRFGGGTLDECPSMATRRWLRWLSCCAGAAWAGPAMAMRRRLVTCCGTCPPRLRMPGRSSSPRPECGRGSCLMTSGLVRWWPQVCRRPAPCCRLTWTTRGVC